MGDGPNQPGVVEAYLAEQPHASRVALEQVVAAIRDAAPGAVERISYRMPAWDAGGIVAYVGGFKRHIGFYPPVDDPALHAEAARYAGPKGNLQFPLNEAMPLDLIRRIVAFRVARNASKRAAAGRPQKADQSATAPPAAPR